MPTAPPLRTLKPFWARPTGAPVASTPPRTQTTILPVNEPGGAGLPQNWSPYGAAEASTTGAGPTPCVMLAPVNVAVAPSLDVTVRVDWNARVCVDAPTVVTHGERCSAVPAPGPELPAEVDTKTPD